MTNLRQLPLLAASVAAALTHRRHGRAAAFPALASTPSESAELAKLMLRQSLLSPSGKLTLSPEIIIPDPTDPTAILLQATEIGKMSEAVRDKAKANAAFIAGTVGSLRTLCSEQESARGNFPGPVPVIYCSSSSYGGASGGCLTDEELAEIAGAGACGVLLTLNGGEGLGGGIDDAGEAIAAAAAEEDFVGACRAALDAGLQPIPEAVIPEESAPRWGEEEVDALVEALTEGCGAEPAGVVLSVAASPEGGEGEGEGEGEEGGGDDEPPAADGGGGGGGDDAPLLPSVSKPLSRRVPILGSVRTPAGGGRIGARVSSLKDAGFTGAVLRCECVPGYRMNPDLDAVGSFWSAAIGDLKSTRSKNFGFRAKVAMPGLEKDVPMEWMKYQKSVMESGALGAPEGGPEGDFDSDAGDYKGF